MDAEQVHVQILLARESLGVALASRVGAGHPLRPAVHVVYLTLVPLPVGHGGKTGLRLADFRCAHVGPRVAYYVLAKQRRR